MTVAPTPVYHRRPRRTALTVAILCAIGAGILAAAYLPATITGGVWFIAFGLLVFVSVTAPRSRSRR